MTKKKIITIAFALVLLISVIGATYAYFATYQEGSSANLTVETGELRLVLNDGTDEHGIISGEIDANHKKTITYLSIENRGLQDTFAKLFFKDLVNNFSNDLVYTLDQIESVPGENESPKVIKRFVFKSPVPSSISPSREELADGLLIKAGTKNGKEVTSNTQYYKVTIEYLYSDTKNQDVDYGKTFYTGFDIEEGDRFLGSVMDLTYNIEDLVELAKEVNSGDSKSGKEFRLMRNLDFNDDDSYLNPTTTEYGDINKNGIVEGLKTELTTGSGWTPIGTESNPYSGTFNGQGYEIQHLYINNNDTSVTNVGMFGAANNATIKNLGIRDENITSTVSSNIGGIIGSLTNGNMENCYNKVTGINNNININYSLFNNSIGGLIGKGDGTLTLSNLNNEANIIGGYATGGIIGLSKSNINISNVQNRGNISINTNAPAATGIYNGGIIGIHGDDSGSNLKIENAVNYGKLSNKKVSADYYAWYVSGGIIGSININSNAIVLNSHNYGDVEDYATSGGIVGQLYKISDSTLVKNKTVIENCSNNGNITTGIKNRANIELGGIIAFARGGNLIINKSYNEGQVLITSQATSAGFAGGLMSDSEGESTSQRQETYILNSFNTGTVHSVTASLSAGLCSLSNYDSDVYFINTYNKGSVTNTKKYSCGIVCTNESSNVTIINNSFNSGDVIGNYKYGLYSIISGSPSVSYTYSYYKNNVSGNGTPMSLEQMMNSSFVTTLNNNLSRITLPSELNGYTLSTWCTSDNGPVLDFEVPESERSTRCPAYNN